jgi:nitroreductase
VEFADVIRRRHMVRSFDARPIDSDVLDRVLDAGRRAPSAGNTHGTDLVVLQDEQTATYWDITLPAARREAFPWPGLLDAPALIVPLAHAAAYVDRYGEADKSATGLGEGVDRWPVPYWHVDTAFAAMSMLLAAVDEGLGALFFGIFSHEREVMAALGVPPDRQPIGTIALGYPADRQRVSVSAKRGRRSLDEVVHRGRW